jgi:hypothetical protein
MMGGVTLALVVPLAAYGVPIVLAGRREKRDHWRDRLAAVAAGQISCAMGRIDESDDGRPEARVGTAEIVRLEDAPPLPPYGTYRLYWLEPVRGGQPLLLSAEPVDAHDDLG